ncbi:hypothetical protein PFISCL1PPCAC_26649, partial [Pristionchus fissidentatus]
RAMIGFLFCVAAAIYYLPMIFKKVAEWIHQYPHIKKLPGPTGLPIVGSILELAGDGKTTDTSTAPLLYWMKCAEKARAEGHQIFSMTYLGRTITFPLNGEMMKIICESPEQLMKGKDYEYLRPWVGDGILLSVGERWKKCRKFFSPMFHFTMLEGYLETFNKHAKVFVEEVSKMDGQEIDMFTYTKRCSLDIITDAAMGVSFDIQKNPDHSYPHAIEVYTLFSQRHNTEPQMWFTLIWFLFYHRQYKHALDGLNNLTEQILKERLKRVQSGDVDLNAKKKPLIDHFLGLYEKGDMTMRDVHYEINAVIFGGHDTTSAAMSWVYWALATQPHFQQQCYEEIHAIFGDDDRECTHEDLKAMEFTERFIREVMRIFAPVPAVERELTSDFQMGNYLLPKGTEIFICAFVLHHNPEAYPDPWKFDPDRFLMENIEKRHPYDYIPFCAGQRSCLGQKFAMQEMKILTSGILRKLSLHSDRNLLDQGFATEVVLKPTLGSKMTVKLRK